MNNLNSSLPKWFLNLSSVGGELAKYHNKNFVFCICLPTLQFSCPAILLGLVKKYLNILSSINKSVINLESLEEGSEIKFKDSDGEIKQGLFIKITERNILSNVARYAEIKIKDAIQLIPEKTAKENIEVLSEEMIQGNNFKIGKKIQNSFHGLEKKILNSKEIGVLKSSLTSKIHIIAQKTTIEKEIKNFNLGGTNFNDVIRIKDYVNQGESYFSTLASPLKIADQEELKDVKFKFYWGSNSFIKFDNSEHQNFNSIIVLSPNETNFVNSFETFQRKFAERDSIDLENFSSLKELNLNYPSMIFRNN